jgi:hypothetical protein
MEGVNAELMPLVKMTVPAEARDKTIAEAPRGEVAFHSWLLVGGALPFDRHALKLERVEPGERFVEESTSLMQKRWRHVRTLEDIEGGCRITDEVTVEPRIGLLAPVVARVVDRIFAHRHKQLREKFGEL